MRRVGYVFSYCEQSYIDKQKQVLKKYKLDTTVIEDNTAGTIKDDVLQEIVNVLKPGDQLVVYELCCLGKTITQLAELLDVLSERKIELVILDKTNFSKDVDHQLVMELIQKIAMSEKMLIRQRTKKGLAEAKKKGKVGGRPKISEETIKKIYFLYHNDSLTLREVAEKCDVSLGTAYKYIKK